MHRKILYYRQTYKLLISNIVMQSKIHYYISSSFKSDTEDIISTTVIQPNKVIDIVTIDKLERGQQNIDNNVTLSIYTIEQKVKRLLMKVNFDMSKEKIISPNGIQVFKKNIKEGGTGFIEGFIQYKFISLNSTEIDEQTFEQMKDNKAQTDRNEMNLEVNFENKRLQDLLREKDNVISVMEQQLEHLTLDAKRAKLILRQKETSMSKESHPISFSVNWKPSQRVDLQYKRLVKENQSLKTKVFKMTDMIQKIQREKKYLHQKMEQIQKIRIAQKTASSNNSKPPAIPKQLSNMSDLVNPSIIVQLDSSEINKNLVKGDGKNSESRGISRSQKQNQKDNQYSDSRQILERKFKGSIQQINNLENQIVQLRIYIKKLTQQLKVLRDNNKDIIMNRINDIKVENDKIIANLRQKGQGNINQTIFAHQRQNYQIQIETLKAIKQQLEDRFSVMIEEIKIKTQDYEKKIYSSQIKQNQLKEQNQLLREKLQKTRAHLKKALKKDLNEQEIAEAASQIAKSYIVIQQEKASIIKNLQEEKIKVLEAQERQRQLHKMLRSRTQKEAQCKRLQLQCQKKSQHIHKCQKQIQKYERRYQELKKYMKQIESTRDKRKISSQPQLSNQIQDRLKVFEDMIGKAQEYFFESQVAFLKTEKDKIIEHYYTKISNAKKLIDDDDTISANQKKKKKEQIQKQIKAQKLLKLEQIENKINKLEFKKESIKQLFTKKSMSVQDRLQDLEKLLKEGEVERRDLLERIQGNQSSGLGRVLDESIFLNKEGQVFAGKEGQDHIKQIDKSLKGSNKEKIDSEAKNSIMKQSSSLNMMRSRYFEEWNKVQEATRKEVKRQQEENTKLKIQNNTLVRKIETAKQQKQRAIHSLKLQYAENEGNLKRTIAKFEKQIQIKENKIASLMEELEKRKIAAEDSKNSIQTLKKQYKILNDELEQQIRQNSALKSKIEGFMNEINSYESTANKLISEVELLNHVIMQNKQQFQRLFNERSNAFLHIQHLRQTQIEKLKRIKEQLQFRLQQEVSSTMRVKGDNSQLFEKNNQLKKANEQYQESINIFKQNYDAEQKQLNQKIKILQDINQQLQNNLMTLAEDFNTIQQRLATNEIQKQTIKKEIESYKHLEKELVELQVKLKEQKKEFQYILFDKKQKLRKMQTDFFVFEQKIKMISQQNIRLRNDGKQKQILIQNFKEKMNEKYLECIKISQEKSIINIQRVQNQKKIYQLETKLSKYPLQISDLKKQNEYLRVKIQELNNQIQNIKKNYQNENVYDNFPCQLENANENIERFRIQSSKNLQITPQQEYIQQSGNKQQSSAEKQQNNISKNIVQINSQASDNQSRISSRSKSKSFSRPNSPNYSNKNIRRSKSSQKNHSFQGPLEVSPLKINEGFGSNTERQMNLLSKISELECERMDLLNRIQQLEQQLKIQKRLSIQKKISRGEIIKINEESLQNTNENSKEGIIANLHMTQSNQMYQTMNSAATDYSAQMKNLELMVEQLEKDKKILNNALQEQKNNNEKLLQMQGQINQLHEVYNNKIEELTKYYQQKIVQLDNSKKEYFEKIEQVVAETMEFDGKLTDSLRQLQNSHNKIIELENQLANYQGELQQKSSQLNILQDKISQMKTQYRRYEQQAELQILMLRQKLEEVVAFNKQKDNQLIQMGQKYLNLQDGADHQNNQMLSLKKDIENINKYNQSLLQNNHKIQRERQQFNESRKKLMNKIHQLQIQLISKHQQIAEANKNAALATAKSNIKVQNIEQELSDLRRRQEEREKVVVTLKNQIANYNDQCLQLKKENEELDYQLQRVTKQLKDIMANYEYEFSSFIEEKSKYNKSLRELQNLLKENEKKLVQIRQDLRQVEKQRINAESELKQIKDQFQKYKLIKQRQYNDQVNAFQQKNNEYEILKLSYEKLVEENFMNETNAQEQREKYNNLYKQNRQKMIRYEEAIEDLSKQINILAEGPDKSIYEQTLFENQLYRTRIAELQQKQHKQRLKISSAQQMIQRQFKKYKANKQAVVQSLQAEMDSYSTKVNELQQKNYYLKRENDRFRGQFERLNEENNDLSDQIGILRQQIDELRQQVQFYKDKRRQQLTKLLNQTND